LDGAIDERGRQAVDFANTHSSGMASDHYHMRYAQRQAQDALRVASIVSPEASAIQATSQHRLLTGSLRSISVAQQPVSQQPEPQPWLSLPWGTAHPLFLSDTIRAPWSESEVVRVFKVLIYSAVQLTCRSPTVILYQSSD
jgi:hypothetical protein